MRSFHSSSSAVNMKTDGVKRLSSASRLTSLFGFALRGQNKVLFAIIILSFIVRFYKLGDIPPSLARDEASIGYTAYSILRTGRDEHGVFLPLSLKSFGDYKLPLYVYSSIPFVFFFGLKTWVVRFPSCLAGTFTVILLFLLAKQIFRSSSIALLSAFFLAVNPWHVYFSRIAYEANLSLFLTVLGILTFIKSTKKSLLLSAFCFGLTMFTYHGAHVFTPIFLTGLIVLHWTKMKKKASLLLFILIILSFIILAFMVTFNQAGKTKMSGVGFFNDPVVTYYRSERKRADHEEINLGVRLIHNRYLIYPYQVIQNYLRVFSPSFLFDKGGENPLHNLEEFGNFYLVDALLMGIGVLALFWQRRQEIKLLAWWILVSPIASAITKDSPHSARSFVIVPPLIIIIAFGFLFFLNLLKKRGILGRILTFSLFGCLYLCIFWYFEAYLVHFPLNRARFFHYTYKRAALLAENLPKAEKVVMAGAENSPYIYFLFNEKYSPEQFQREVEHYAPTPDLFYHVKSFGRYHFTARIDWRRVATSSGTLFIDDLSRVPKKFPIDGCLRLPSGEPHLGWYTTLDEIDKREAKEKFKPCDLSTLDIKE